jgi:hypothetical protein
MRVRYKRPLLIQLGSKQREYCIAFAILAPVQVPLAIGIGMIPFAAPSSRSWQPARLVIMYRQASLKGPGLAASRGE